MEGNTHTLGGSLQKGNRVTIEGDDARYYLIAADSSFSINFNLKDSGIMQKRIIFNAGTIEISEATPNSLRMRFKGSGHPLTDSKSFPIEGAIDATFQMGRPVLTRQRGCRRPS
jgi:hypothetical protein